MRLDGVKMFRGEHGIGTILRQWMSRAEGLILCFRAFWNNHVALWSVGARRGVVGRKKNERHWEVDSVVDYRPLLRRARVYVARGPGTLPTLRWRPPATFRLSTSACLLGPSLFPFSVFLFPRSEICYIIKTLSNDLWQNADLVRLQS
jgi:hypothetical protein